MSEEEICDLYLNPSKGKNYISKDKIKEIFSNKRNEIIFIKNRNERLYKVKILDEIEKELLKEGDPDAK